MRFQTLNIRCWRAREVRATSHDWESGVTRIATVADDLYQFINSLEPVDEPE